MTPKLPCIDCITLPICKADANKYDKGQEGIKSIYDKCVILRDYLEQNYKTIHQSSPAIESVDFLVVYKFFLPHIIDKLLYQQRHLSRLKKVKRT